MARLRVAVLPRLMVVGGGDRREGNMSKAVASRCGRRVVPRGTSILGRAPSPWWVMGISKRPSRMDSLRSLASSARRRSEERLLNAPEESPRRPLSASLPFGGSLSDSPSERSWPGRWTGRACEFLSGIQVCPPEPRSVLPRRTTLGQGSHEPLCPLHRSRYLPPRDGCTIHRDDQQQGTSVQQKLYDQARVMAAFACYRYPRCLPSGGPTGAGQLVVRTERVGV
jgi:hypothetical protein